ncbi:MAG: sulfotransferase [Phycisphaerales bacterium]|nr:sulfotransferase [Phycisphaerales bacterium]
MHARLEGQSLQELPDEAATREAIVEEYVDSERRFLTESQGLGLIESQRLVRMRYDDLVAAPLAELERVCTTLGLRWDGEVRRRATTYLAEVGEYRARKHQADKTNEDPRLADLEQALTEGLPPRREPEPPPPAASRGRGALPGVLGALLGAAACLAVWLWLAHLTHRRLDLLTWPLGVVVGRAALRGSGRGDWKLGLCAAIAVGAMVLASVWPLPEIANGWVGPDRFHAMRDAYGSFNNNYVYMLFGMLAAYRYGSRRFLKPPGM